MTTRISKRRRSSATGNHDDHPLRPLSCSIHAAKFCIQLGIPEAKCCSGCVSFAQSVGLLIDDRDHDEMMANKLSSRWAPGDQENSTKTHKYRDFHCKQLWLMEAGDTSSMAHFELASWQKGFIRTHLKRNPDRLVITNPECQSPMPVRRLASVLSESPADGCADDAMADHTANDEEDVAVEQEQQINFTASPTTKRTVNFTTWNISSQKQCFSIDVPNSHVIITRSKLVELQNDQTKVKSLQRGFSGKRFTKKASELMKTYLVVALASVPGLAIKAAAYLIPMIVSAFLVDHDLIPEKDDYVKNFPSETYLRGLMMDAACKATLKLAVRLRSATAVFIACDKGNKKGMDHFIKYLVWWDHSLQRVVFQVLDMDASMGSHIECGLAIAKSLKKLEFEGTPLILQGQCTDSGGGGVLEGLAIQLRSLGVTKDEYSVLACGIHSLQLQISRPIKELIGDGGLDNRNAMQLLHSIYDVQSYQDWNQCRHLLNQALEFTDLNCSNDIIAAANATAGDIQFAERWNIARKFRSFTPIGETKW